MTEAWRGEAFAFRPPPGLPPDRGEEKKGGASLPVAARRS